jgi:hypothetical protein
VGEKRKSEMKKLIKRFNEFIGIPVAVLLFFLTPPLLRMIDPTAGAFDAGYLHAIVLGLVKVFMASAIAWILLWMSFPKLYRYLDDDAENDIIFGKTIERPNRALIPVLIYLAYFIGLLYGFVPD